jgi:secreted PhoX family phosphatase
VFEVRRRNGAWEVVRPSSYARRITANTPMRISGPAAGDTLLRTAADPAGTDVLGTANNCAAGYTPWGTYLTCEENWNGYFGVKGATDPVSGLVQNAPSTTARTNAQQRYGLSVSGFNYRWHHVDGRFDFALNPNEPHRFGWVVEIDPFDPSAQPVKRTAMGRFKHESAMVVVGADNTVAVYSGDDERNDYVYKFVATRKYNPSNRAANRDLLDEGTLYVAKFNADGTGTWIPLVHGQNGLTPANGFANQAEVLIKTRQAADRVDATEMDRPEWVAAHPTTREIYLTLTNNNRRGSSPASVNATAGTTTAASARPPIDAANPRANNIYGHIIRWRETAGDVAATGFEWDIYALAGDSLNASANLQGNINGDDFGAPDGLWFDRDGRLWIQTDQQGDATGDWVNIGGNMLLASDPATKEVRRFMTSPPNCEVTGITGTPDGKTLFVGIQHPGEDWAGSFTQKSSWPDNGLNGPTTLSGAGPVKPRSSTLVITRDDGGKIGTI